ncbi:hypothetical protein ABPG72_016474 [Tetrahymena utriculariae]
MQVQQDNDAVQPPITHIAIEMKQMETINNNVKDTNNNFSTQTPESIHHQKMQFTQEELVSKGKTKYTENIEIKAGFFSFLTFFWTQGIMSIGSKREKEKKYLQQEDLYDCRPQEQPLFAYNFMEEHLIQQIRSLGRQGLHDEAEHVKKMAEEKLFRKQNGEKGIKQQERPFQQRKIVEKVLKMLGLKTFILACVLATIANLLQFSGPLFLNAILNYIQSSSDEPQWHGYLWATLLTVCYLLRTFILQHSMHLINFLGLQVLNALSSSIYTKIMRVSSSTRKYFDTGKTMNLISVDSQAVFQLIMLGTFLISSPIMVVVSMALIIVQIGPIGLVAPVFFIFGAFLQKKINAAAFAIRKILLTFTDKRSKSVNEFFEGIRIIKYYAWEDMVSERIFNIRQNELKGLMKSQILKSLIEVTMNVTPLLMSILIFGLYAAIYTDFNSAKAYTVLSLFNLLLIPLRMVTMVLMLYLNAKASMTRIEFYLMSEEREEDVVIKDDPSLKVGEIEINNGNFAWESVTAAIHNEQGMKFMRQGGPPGGLQGQKKPTPGNNEKPKGPGSYQQNEKLATQNDQLLQKEEDFNKLTPLEELSLKNLNILKNINLKVKQGQMMAIVGQVASGKSSLLLAILGEMKKNSGEVKLKGKVAYVPQTAWLQNATLRDNVLFGQPWDEKKYNDVIDRCQLRSEIENGEVLPGGDMTEIGERGINLSGGQKQRVAIARAMYSDADIYIIDDCLSALDSHVGKNVFDLVLKGALKNKTVVFVTHALHYMPEVERIVVMKDGELVEDGTHDYLKKNGQEYIRLNQLQEEKKQEEEKSQKEKSKSRISNTEDLELENGQENEENDEDKLAEDSSMNHDPDLPSAEKLDQKNRQSEVLSQTNKVRRRTVDSKIDSEKEKIEESQKKLEIKKQVGKIVQKEERATGAVPGYVYKKYINFSGLKNTLVMFSCFCFAQAFKMVSDWWIGQWSSDSYELNTGAYIGIYAILILFSGLFIFLRGYTFGIFSLKSSQNFQQSLLSKLLHTPLWWFDITPTGRIVARTSKDQDDLDSSLPWNMQFAVTNIIQLIATCIMIGVILPLFFIVFFIAFFIYVRIIGYYLITAREIKRLEANTRAPVISHYQESINGLYVIRAYGKERDFIQKMLLNERDYIISFTNMNYTNRWISIITEIFALIIISGTAYFGVLSKQFNYQSNGSLIGLALTYSFQISAILSFTLKLIADTESGMNAVLRMLQYIEKNPQENDWRSQKPIEKWPQQGQYKLDNITYKYREELPTVINGISFDIKNNEKIGVVGRTGSGKSTLTLGLMRILELIQDNNGQLGKISLDGENIRDIGLHDLREKVTIIPQDPLLFSGTIRSNIDPYKKYTDSQICDVLQKVEIWNQLDSILQKQLEKESKEKKQDGQLSNNPNYQMEQTQKKKLEIVVEGGGSNFSLGQRQLICIARALIKKPKVLLMDEATASIDEMTDRLIQNMIKKELTQTTVVTIAHRLKTIIQYDRIVVLELGNLKEIETPSTLLENENSYFYKLVNTHGKQFYDDMKMLAKNKDLDVY